MNIGPYVVISEIYRTKPLTIYHCKDPETGDYVAVKVLTLEIFQERSYQDLFRLETEIMATATMQEAPVVPMYGAGEHEGQPYLVLKYMSGGSLEDQIPEGGMAVKDALPIIERIAAALDVIHDADVIHRDVKPENILFDENGDAYLADFGGVKALTKSGHTTSSDVLGTMHYMAPEAVQAEYSLSTDIYSFAVTIFEMLTGTHPFQGDTVLAVMMAHINQPVPDITDYRPDLSRAVTRVIRKAAAKSPSERYQSAGKMFKDLKQALETPIAQPSSIVTEEEEIEDMIFFGDAAPEPEVPATERGSIRDDVGEEQRDVQDNGGSQANIDIPSSDDNETGMPEPKSRGVFGGLFAKKEKKTKDEAPAASKEDGEASEQKESGARLRRATPRSDSEAKPKPPPAPPAPAPLAPKAIEPIQEQDSFIEPEDSPDVAPPVEALERIDDADEPGGNALRGIDVDRLNQGMIGGTEGSGTRGGEPEDMKRKRDEVITGELSMDFMEEQRKKDNLLQTHPVLFSAYYPDTIEIDTSYKMLVYLHVPQAMLDIQSDAETYQDQLGGRVPAPRVAEKVAQLVEDTIVSVTPESDDIEFEPVSVAKRWRAPWVRFDFNFSAPEHLVGQQVTGRISISVSAIEIAHIDFSAKVIKPQLLVNLSTHATANPLYQAKLNHATSKAYQRIFISYSRDDAVIAEAYRQVQIAMGNDVFMDTHSLRAGEDWQAALARAIDEADILQLFWSPRAAASDSVRHEWDYALRYRCGDNRCVDFIRPVFWENPLHPPPEELGHLNFRYVSLKPVAVDDS